MGMNWFFGGLNRAGSTLMDIPPEEHTFLIRIRLVTRESVSDPVFWRGTIEHLRSQTKQSIKNEQEINSFIRGFLNPRVQEQSTDFLYRWLKRLGLSGSNRRPKQPPQK